MPSTCHISHCLVTFTKFVCCFCCYYQHRQGVQRIHDINYGDSKIGSKVLLQSSASLHPIQLSLALVSELITERKNILSLRKKKSFWKELIQHPIIFET